MTQFLSYDGAKALLEKHGQSHVLKFWERLDAQQRSRLLEQIAGLDFDAIGRLKALLAQPAIHGDLAAIEPAPVVSLSPDERRLLRGYGEAGLRAGEVGVLVVAGGQGSRLGFDGPKGVLPIAPVSNASLFEIHARKVLALTRKYAARVPFYIMTSQANDAATREFFRQNEHFGLSRDDVRFFVQGMWPALTKAGEIVLDEPSHIFVSPDGHGGILSALQAEGMLADMEARRLTTLFYFQVDNPLVDVADPAFIGLHRQRQAEVSVKVCAKRDPDEGLGVVAIRGGKNAIVEYTELTDAQKKETTPDGRLKFLYGSVAIHAFSLPFLAREAKAGLPIHIAHKKVPWCDVSGQTVKPDRPNAYKFEKFVFDVLPDARRVVHLAFDREDEFSPIKNGKGADSPEMARRDLVRKYARWLELCGVKMPRTAEGEPVDRVEVDPCFALDAAELRSKLPPSFTAQGDVLLR